MYRKFNKSIKGNENEQVESFSHNNVRVETSASLTLLSIYVCLLVTASIIFMAIAHMALLQAFIVATFCSCFVCGWIVLLSFTARHVSATRKAMLVDTHERDQAQLGADVIYATESYILFRDPEGNYQFRGTVTVTENRQFLPTAISAPSQQEAILECFDRGMSGRAIEKWLKDSGDKKISYREIAKTLDLYRPGWNKKGGVVESDLTDSE